MQRTVLLAGATAACALAGCAHTPAPGDTTAQVIAKMGQPDAVYAEGNGQQFEYASGPQDNYTWMAHIGPDGRLVRIEQVLTDEKFATIQVGRATRDDVLRTVGHPAEVSCLDLRHWNVSSYRYLQSGTWHAMMNVAYDRNGIVRHVESGFDPMYLEASSLGP